MDKASDFGSEDCEFESRRGRLFLLILLKSTLLVVDWTMKNNICQKKSLSEGFEPAREDPNGFLVHRLNHSATTTER